MSAIPCFQVDAFTSRRFSGNPAAVCPLTPTEWLEINERVMQAIAMENALSETAFFAPRLGSSDDFDLRWFTPTVEVDLCGHATLASAFVLMNELEPSRTFVRFFTRSGALTVQRRDGQYTLNFPSRSPTQIEIAQAVSDAIQADVLEAHQARDLIVVLQSAEHVRALNPDFAKIAALPNYALIVTAAGSGGDSDVDFVSRFFAPKQGINEDPVTGSAHCELTPFWSKRLNKTSLIARQVSARTGELHCELVADRVLISGEAVMVKRGTFELD